MRISTNAFYNSVSGTVSRLQNELGDLTIRMAEEKRVSKPSDDPQASIIINRTHTELAASDAKKTLWDSALRTQQQVDATLSQITEQLTSAVNTAMRAQQTTSQSDTTQLTAAESLRSISEAILNAANTKLGDRYLFAGFQDQDIPFTSAADIVTYNGDANQLTVPLGAGRTCPVSVTGSRLFNFDGAVDGVSGNVFEVLENIAQALEDGDTTAISTNTDQLNKLYNHVVGLRGSVGSWEVRLQANRDALDELDIRYQEILSSEESMDLADGITEYKARETTYKAVLEVFSQLMSMPTMFDLLR